MENLSYSMHGNVSNIYFDIIYSSGTMDTYFIEFETEGENIVSITINIISTVDYGDNGYVVYYFGGINDSQFTIYPPI